MSAEEKTITFSHNSVISISLALVLGGYAVWIAVQNANTQSNILQLQKDVVSIQNSYVPNNMLTLQLENIKSQMENVSTRLANIEKAVTPKGK